MQPLINFIEFKSDFDKHKDLIERVSKEDLLFLWLDDYYDGMLSGILEYEKRKFRFEIITDYAKGIYPRVFALVTLSENQFKEEMYWHNLFIEHVGNHNDFMMNDKLLQKPQTEHHLFYDKYKHRKNKDYNSNAVKAWYVEQ